MNLKKMLTPPKRLNPFWRSFRAERDQLVEELAQLVMLKFEQRLAELAVQGATAARLAVEDQLRELKTDIAVEIDRRFGFPEGLSPGD
jgi:hypothetical protein